MADAPSPAQRAIDSLNKQEGSPARTLGRRKSTRLAASKLPPQPVQAEPPSSPDDLTMADTHSPPRTLGRRKSTRLLAAASKQPPQPVPAEPPSSPDELLSQWLRRLHFRVFTERISVSKTVSKPLTASEVQKPHMIEYYSWRFFTRLATVRLSAPDKTLADPSTSSTPLTLHDPPTVTMETAIVTELRVLERSFRRSVISVPQDWKVPYAVPYDGMESPANGEQALQELQKLWEAREETRQDLIVALERGESCVRWQKDRRYLETIDYNVPNITLGETVFPDHFYSIKDLLAFVPLGPSEPMQDEYSIEVRIASKAAHFYRSPTAVTQRGAKISFPRSLGPFRSHAKPDVAMVMKLENWGMNLAPLCFAGETKKPKTNGENTPAQLAWSLQSSLNLLILYHLHHRTSTQDRFPAWMYILGVVQDRNGIKIYAHFPRMIFGPESNESGMATFAIPSPEYPHWGYGSVLVSDHHQHAFRLSDMEDRFALLSALLTIQAHTHFLTMQFRKWKPEPHEMLELRECAKKLPPTVTPEPQEPVPFSSPWSFASKSFSPLRLPQPTDSAKNTLASRKRKFPDDRCTV